MDFSESAARSYVMQHDQGCQNQGLHEGRAWDKAPSKGQFPSGNFSLPHAILYLFPLQITLTSLIIASLLNYPNYHAFHFLKPCHQF